MVGASANADFKSVLCYVVFLVNLNVLIYIYMIISDTSRAKRYLIYIQLGGIFGS